MIKCSQVGLLCLQAPLKEVGVGGIYRQAQAVKEFFPGKKEISEIWSMELYFSFYIDKIVNFSLAFEYGKVLGK